MWQLLSRSNFEFSFFFFLEEQIATQVADGNFRPTLHPNIGGLAELVTRCWAPNPLNRPDFSEINVRLEEVIKRWDKEEGGGKKKEQGTFSFLKKRH